MAVTVQQLISDAKRLVSRLRDHDNEADSIVSQAETLSNNLDAIKQYHKEIEILNSLAHQRPRSALILNIQQENRQIRELQQENRELRFMLEEHQSALDLIMNKYRRQVHRIAQTKHWEKTYRERDKTEELVKREEKIKEMAAIMKKAVEIDDENYEKEMDTVQKLIRENELLRDILEISTAEEIGFACKFRLGKVDEAVQTEL